LRRSIAIVFSLCVSCPGSSVNIDEFARFHGRERERHLTPNFPNGTLDFSGVYSTRMRWLRGPPV
jgi:hypothetical protein